MKLNVKTLKGLSFEIEAEREASVAEVKRILEGALGQNEYPAEELELIFHGKFLKNDTTLDSNKVAENSFIVAVLSMPETSPGPFCAAKTATPVALTRLAALATPATPVPETAPSQGPVAVSQSQAASNLVSDNDLEPAIQQILDMRGGVWECNTVVRALHASNYDIERAADYMYLGIPGNVEALVQTVQQSSHSPGPDTRSINLFPQDVPSGETNPAAAVGPGVIESVLQQQPTV